jgi:hypothetical protein
MSVPPYFRLASLWVLGLTPPPPHADRRQPGIVPRPSALAGSFTVGFRFPPPALSAVVLRLVALTGGMAEYHVRAPADDDLAFNPRHA